MEIMEKNRRQKEQCIVMEEVQMKDPKRLQSNIKQLPPGFKGNCDEKEVKAMIEEIVKTLGMKEEKYMIDCPCDSIK